MKADAAAGALDIAGGLALIAATLVALILSNSPARELYHHALDLDLAVSLGPLSFATTPHHLINDGLMAVFFLAVGLEIKREFLEGHLAEPAAAAMPLFAALGGMIAPALIYVLMARGAPGALAGFAIPAATDIGFAVGILALLAARVPPAVKTFLVALAIIDDLGAIVIIAIFYVGAPEPVPILSALVLLAGLAGLARLGLRHLGPYLLTGVAIWGLVAASGVHATLAGVALALVVPSQAKDPAAPSPMLVLEHALKPYVALGILPIFALANAGLALDDVNLAALGAPITLGVTLGLILGKPLGVLAGGWLGVKMGLARWPKAPATSLLAGASLAGIGFTMSLFIAGLAFADGPQEAQARLGILIGSLLAALIGSALFFVRSRPT